MISKNKQASLSASNGRVIQKAFHQAVATSLVTVLLLNTALAGPLGGQVAAGAATIAGQGTTAVHVTQSSQNVVINWNSFDTNANESVNFHQPNANAIALNRVMSGSPTQFNGQLNANGKVIVMNGNGVVFGQSAKVDVGGLVATTADIDTNDFMNGGVLNFNDIGQSNAAIINKGSITARDGGLVGFVAPHVENNGLIQARLGKVQLASGDSFTYDFYGDGLVQVKASDAVNAQLVQNSGTIKTDGGSILMSVAQARDIVDSLISNTGSLEAKTVEDQGGTIILRGDDADVVQDGTIDVSGVKGGDVDLHGKNVLIGGAITATGTTGNGGAIKVIAKNKIEASAGAVLDVSGAKGGRIIQNAKASISSGTYKAVGTQGEGGTIDWGGNVTLLNGKLDASGKTKGGQIRLGGTWKNQSANGWDAYDQHLDPSTNIFISTGSELKAKATGAHGDGGEIVLRAQDKTYFAGSIDATPGTQSGNGGRAEISGADIALVDGNAVKTGLDGRNGDVLLDPKNITITNAAADALQTAKIGFAYAGSNDQFGQSVALNAVGDIMVVGASLDDTGGNDRGAVYVFRIDTSNLSSAPVMERKITSATAGISVVNGANIGRSVSLNGAGNLLAIGVMRDSSVASERGSVYLLGLNTSNLSASPTVYRKLESGVDGITLTNTAYFGSGVALNAAGNILAVGSERHDSGGTTDSGAVYIFTLDTSNFSNAATLNQVISKANTTGLNLTNNNYFGTGLALNGAGNILAVGTLGDTSPGGAAYLFNLDTSNLNSAALLRKKLANGVGGITLGGGDAFGFDVALNDTGSILVVGAHGTDSGRGAIHILSLDPNDLTINPGLIKKISNGTSGVTLAAGDYLGISVAINGAGTILASGAKYEDNGGTADVGTVRVFDIAPLTLSGGLSYGHNAAGNTTLSATLISQLLAAGNNLTLQANNDITISNAITVNNPTGNGANLTLQAGRSVVFNANVTTDNGNLIVIANDTLANGVVDAYRDAGNAAITMGAATSINAGTGSVQFLMRDGAGKTNRGVGDVTLYGVTAGSILVEGQRDVFVNGAISISGAAGATLRAYEDIGFAAAGSLTTQGGDILLNSDHDETNGGGIYSASGADIISNGGDISFVGGVNGDTYAIGTAAANASGVYLVGTTVNASGVGTGGDIFIMGRGWAASTAAVGTGVLRPMGLVLNGSSVRTNNDGKIDITGLGDGQTTASGSGIMLSAGSRITAARGDINITGTGGGTGTGTYREGFVLSQTGHNIVETTETGDIFITGTGVNTNNSSGVVFNNNTANSGILTKDGNITVTGIALNAGSSAFASNNGVGTVVGGANATGTITLIGDDFSFSPAPYLQTTGDIIIRPYDATKTISIGTGGNLALTTAILARITAGGTLWVGGYGNLVADPGFMVNTGNITFNTATAMANNMALMTSGTVSTSAAVNMAAGKNLSITANTVALNHAVSGTGDLVIQAATQNRSVNVNFGLDDGSNMNLTTAELNRLTNGWDSITIGRADSTAYLDVGAHTWNDALTLRAQYIRIDGAINATESLAFQAIGTEFQTSGSIVTSNDAVSFSGDLSFYDGNGSITTSGGSVTIGNRLFFNSLSASPTINSGNGNISIASDVLAVGSVAGKTMTLSAGTGAVNFGGTINGDFDLTVSGQSIGFNGAVGGTTRLGNVSLVSTNSMMLPSIRASSVFARTTGIASVLTIGAGSALDANAADTNITLVTNNDFVRGAGSTLTTGAGRYLIYLTDPASTTLNGLSGDFNRYTCSYGSCSVIVPLAGNGLLYAYTPMLDVTPDSVTITYGNSANLNNYAYTVSGYLAGDNAAGDITGTLNGSTDYTVGNNIGSYSIDHSTGTLVSAMGYGFNYLDVATALTVDRRVITVDLTGSANKVYDGGTGAILDSADYTIDNVYNADDVSITNTVGVYDDKNVGINKEVTVSGLALGGAKANNYTLNGVTSVAGNIGEITQASLTVTANNVTKTYGDTVNFAGTEFSQSGLIAGDTLTSIDLTSAGAGAGATVAGGPYDIEGSNAVGTGLSNYDITYVDGTLTIDRASLTVTANDLSKVYGTTLNFSGTEYTQNGLVNGDTITNVDLTSAGSGAGATVAGGPYDIEVSNATGSGLSNYDITYVDGTLTIDRASLTITANDLSKVYGTTTTFIGTEYTQNGLVNGDTITNVDLSSTGSGAGATVAGGPYDIEVSNATGSGLGNYDITYVDGTLTVTAATLTITANSITKTYGDTVVFAGTEYTQNGLVNGDTITNIDLTSVGSSAGATVAGGPYDIEGSNAVGTGLSNYDITYVDGTLTIDRAALTVTANDTSKVYGTTLNFAGTEFSQTGLLNGDSITDVDFASTGAAAGATVAGGPYDIEVSNATGSGLDNYNITYVDGTLTIDRASLTVTANDLSKVYGTTATFTGTEYTQNGLVNGDTITNVDLTSAGSGAGATVAGGPYDIEVSNATGSGLGNYDITYVDGALTVTRASLTIDIHDATKIYGSTLTFNGTEYTQNGLVNGDTITNVDLTSAGSGAGATVAGGPYAIEGSNATGTGLDNYTIAYNDGTLTIDRADLTITANDTSKVYGTTLNFAGTEFSQAGLLNGDSITDVDFTSTGAAAGATVAGGPYDIEAGNATGSGLDNYNITYVDGSLTVTRAALTVTANSVTKTYGDTINFTGTEYTQNGLVNGDTITYVDLTSAGSGAGATVAGGPYDIVASNASGSGLGNYDIVYSDGTLTVDKAVLNVIANSIDKIGGTSYTFDGTEYTQNGLVNGDTITNIDLISAGADVNAVEGSYAIVASNASGAGLANYDIVYTDGNMNVLPVVPVSPNPGETLPINDKQLYDPPIHASSDHAEAAEMMQTANDTVEDAGSAEELRTRGCLYSMIGFYDLGNIGNYLCRY